MAAVFLRYKNLRFCAMLIAAVALFLSCASKKIITEQSECINTQTHILTDTTSTEDVKEDTTSTSHIKNTTESETTEIETIIEKSDSTIIVVDESGNIKKTEIWHKRNNTTIKNREYEKTLNDSIQAYRHTQERFVLLKSKLDSIQREKHETHEKVIELQKNNKKQKFALEVLLILCIFVATKKVLLKIMEK